MTTTNPATGYLDAVAIELPSTTTTEAQHTADKTPLKGGLADATEAPAPAFLTLDATTTACPSCGIPVPWDADAVARGERVNAYDNWDYSGVPTIARMTGPGMGANAALGWRQMARCPSCEHRHALALALFTLVDHDALHGVAVTPEAVEATLGGLALAGGELFTGATNPDADALARFLADPVEAHAQTLAALRLFLPLGRAALWSHAIATAPAKEGVALLEQAPSSPWGHTAPQLRAQALAARMALSTERDARHAEPVVIPTPTPIAPPSNTPGGYTIEGGCMVCGVDHATIPADRALRLERIAPGQSVAAVWTPRTTPHTNLATRYRGAAVAISGFLCPACREAVDREGNALGWSAISRSLLTHHGLWGRVSAAGVRGADLVIPTFGGLVFDAARTSGGTSAPPAPSPSRWQHVDIAALLGSLDLPLDAPASDSPREG